MFVYTNGSICCTEVFGYSAAAPQAVFLPADLSPGLAALTVGCHSGNLGSMSRVQLLLLNRMEPEDEGLSPLQDLSGFRMHDDAGLTSSGIPTMHQ